MTEPNDKSEVVAQEAPDNGPQDNSCPDSPSSCEDKPAELTAEEQMALYEESLKETDWGHQPC
jgi:hypothetical protein